jgi:hypothetical protein
MNKIVTTANETGTAGIGLAGMRERVADLGGELRVRSNKKGTVLSYHPPTWRTLKFRPTELCSVRAIKTAARTGIQRKCGQTRRDGGLCLDL